MNCPNCGHVFAVSDPPPAAAACPACGLSVRLRLEDTGPAGPLGIARRRLPRAARTFLAGMVGFAVCLLGLVAYQTASVWLSGRGERPRPRSSAYPVRLGPLSVKGPLEFQESRARQGGRQPPMKPDELFAVSSPAVVRVLVDDADHHPVGQGSGFLVSRDGWVVTNYHVIEPATYARIVLEDYTELPVLGVAATDRRGDLALLKVPGHDMPCLLLATGLPPRVGEKVYVIGSPRGLINTLSEGLISGHRTENGLDVLQTTAPMGPGSSGGPLLTAEGRVVGVSTRVRPGGQNLNFAVPAERIRELLRKQGKVVPLAKMHGRAMGQALLVQLDEAWAAMDKEDWQRARAMLSRLAANHPDNPYVWLAWGHLCRRTGLYKPAVEAFEAALRLKPDYAEAWLNMGLTYLDQKALAEILYEYRRKDELTERARQALIKAAEFDPAGPTGRV
ncbi:MAG: trypsin-like peptidase domain-containing protein, partial [Planctomycetes bacterium]|nr:trypsin-like peptidase domain-containing protein [Planctomycetota bacterium]